jgi:nifR3 family TIM-barrel protein
MRNFWKTLPKPFFVLAPMADVTDVAFRHVIAKYGKPDVTWTEFVSADGLYHTREIQKMKDEDNPLLKDLLYSENERPIVAQLFSSNPDMIEYASALVAELGFDGVDINMGCPHRAIEKQGAGASLMKNPALAREIIRSAKRGVKNAIPVSVKTRIGYKTNELETWLPELLKEKPDAITVHARTRKELSEVPARWEHVREAVDIRNSLGLKDEVLILGNGDVKSVREARERVEETGADGVMIGRGIFGNPWLFSEVIPTKDEKMRVLLEHCRMYEKTCGHKSFALMKKHFKAYVTGFKGAKELRIKLFECDTVDEIEKILVEENLIH